MSLGLYIHIPFCRSRCPYCDFAFVVRKNHLAGRYIDAVINELHTRLPNHHTACNTVYFGGGTPSAIPPDQLSRVLDVLRDRLTKNAELTAEANPGDQAHFAALKTAGINRLSLGIQALTDRALKALGRFHTTRDAIDAFCAARRAGFDNLSIDLIYGAPEQSPAEWAHILDQAITLTPEHISVYGLTIEPNTNFARRDQKGHLHLPAENQQADMYKHAINRLTDAGYEHYEISNFAKPGFASRHNLTYWEERPYLGVGLSAHSFINNRRSWNVSDLILYMERVEQTGQACEGEEHLAPSEQLLERIMLGLRQRKGLCIDLVKNNAQLHHQYQHLASRHLLERVEDRIRLTPQGLLLADLVCAELVKNS